MRFPRISVQRVWSQVICSGTVLFFIGASPLLPGGSAARAMAVSPMSLDAGAADVGKEVTLLRDAYVAMESANHDYKGHRVAAMRAVAAASKELGTEIRGQGNSKTIQPSSDDGMKTAEGIIKQVQQAAQNFGQTKVLDHLAKAIKEIDTALAVD